MRKPKQSRIVAFTCDKLKPGQYLEIVPGLRDVDSPVLCEGFEVVAGKRKRDKTIDGYYTRSELTMLPSKPGEE
jgi:hypothetical protein